MKHVDFNTVATSAISALVPQLKTAYLPALDLDLADATEEEAIASLLAPGRRRASRTSSRRSSWRDKTPRTARP